MEKPRAPSVSELDHVVAFLDSELRPQADWSIKDEYPTVFQGPNRGNIRIITENEKILSHAVIKYHIVRTIAGLFKVASIGSVVTHNQYRNRGFSQSILEDCVDTARLHGADFAILWSDLHEFYRKVGFELAGREISFDILTELACHSPAGMRFQKGNNVDPEALLRVYNQHTLSTVRSVDDIRAYMKIPKTQLYTAWSSDGMLRAYMVEGKGADLEGHIHEWGGPLDALLPLVNFAIRDQKRALKIIGSDQAHNLIRRLTDAGCPRFDGYLGLVKILNFESLYGKIKKFARMQGQADFVLERQEGWHYFGRGVQVFKTDSDLDMVRLIFGPQRASEIHHFDPVTAKSLEAVLPIPMWLWGWDSV